jgi:hypothetical protein
MNVMAFSASTTVYLKKQSHEKVCEISMGGGGGGGTLSEALKNSSLNRSGEPKFFALF